ncbi:MAG: YigZ family protein [Eubacteriaceae bacterium]
MDYLTIRHHILEEFIVKKSKFIINCYCVNDEKSAIDYLKDIQKLHYKATHNTYAYIIGEKKGIQKFSDDGEPSGTAGKPIFEVISQNDLTNILIIVTRYFGGIKLGAGGLVRAYSNSAKLGINSCEIIKMQYSALYKITSDYNLFGKLQDYLNNNKNIILHEIIYEDQVYIYIYLSIINKKKIIDDLIEISNDSIKYNLLKEEYIPIAI